jgi:hypothetical protein
MLLLAGLGRVTRDEPGRSEAIRCLVELGLRVKGK